MRAYRFKPIFQERIWGGRNLERLYKRELPEGKIIGESWELSDLPEAVTEILSGPGTKVGKGETLTSLWRERRTEIFGTAAPSMPRFPLLLKLLDAQDKLSVQVHPRKGSQTKTEMWIVLDAQPHAMVYSGLKKGVTKEQFAKAMGTPDLAKLLHGIPTTPGDAVFLPSGRVHAIGGGQVIFEVQQSSDTTYRVDDWGRVDAKGNPRELHREQALENINFNDYEPLLVQPHSERMLQCRYFTVDLSNVFENEHRVWTSDAESCQIHFLASGRLDIDKEHKFETGDLWLVPANSGTYTLNAVGEEGAELITITWGR
jgi:mannose-6-phosphate isomerase